MTRVRNARFKNDLSLEEPSWSEMLLPLYRKYRLNITWGDQDLLNIIFHHNPGTSSVLQVCHPLDFHLGVPKRGKIIFTLQSSLRQTFFQTRGGQTTARRAATRT